MDDELYHHGVKGMRWGVWNEETRNRYAGHNRPNGVIEKGYRFARVSKRSPNPYHKHDPLSGNMKYVNTNPEDFAKWVNYFMSDTSPNDLGGVMYEAKKDLKVATAKVAGDEYAKLAKSNKRFGREANTVYSLTNKKAVGLNENESYLKALGNKDHDDITKTSIKEITASLALQNSDTAFFKSGNELIKRLSNLGYDAVEDAIGWNTAVDPIIVFNPKENLNVVYDQWDERYNKKQ